MKKITLFFLSILLTFSVKVIASEPVKTLNGKEIKNLTEVQGKERIEFLQNRLFDIENMSHKDLSGQEKKELKKEVKNINRELKELDGGIYISSAALLVIILLILIL